MRPILLFWKRRKPDSFMDRLVENLIYTFQLIKLSMTFTWDKEWRRQVADLVHVAVYFPDIDKTYDMHGEYKFPFTFGGGARVRKGLVKADVYKVFKDEIPAEQYADIKNGFQADVDRKLKYNFPRILALMLVFLIPWFFVLIRRMPFSRDVFGECCISWIEELFADGGIDLVSYGHDQGHAVGELMYSPLLYANGDSLTRNQIISYAKTGAVNG